MSLFPDPGEVAVQEHPQALRVLQAIGDCIDTHGWAPTIRELKRPSRTKTTSVVHYYLRRLAEAGYIKRGGGCPPDRAHRQGAGHPERGGMTTALVSARPPAPGNAGRGTSLEPRRASEGKHAALRSVGQQVPGSWGRFLLVRETEIGHGGAGEPRTGLELPQKTPGAVSRATSARPLPFVGQPSRPPSAGWLSLTKGGLHG